ncbi:hypothetical protein NBO_19g0002 [Nosema bombycis CQ1]|uniref:Uncharacterized protein n=1 Tax=Nosema bombycis (strain CQ1 / CVCC 102059) TaxID=578461 RepID=R0M9I8_NOSB1|nr:hypothetical protein NBO_19g0002 [Nosema bombycis CQ1]|eukprot:EOB14649.1 hypothetical protein NBO_19g0002 [Nosema bombycis CQ1]
MPMILKNLLIYLVIVSTSDDSINRKRTFDNAQNVSSLKLQNCDSIEDQPLDLSTKRIKIEENLPTESSTISNEDVANLNDENIETQLIGAFKKLLIGTLNVLNSVFCIYERRLLDLSNCKELELENLKMRVDWYVRYLQESENFIIYRNINTESAFTTYL